MSQNFLLSDDHFNLFGRITYLYADLEVGLKFLCSAMLRIDSGIFMMLSEPYNTRDTRNIVTSIANAATFENEEEKALIVQFAGDLKGASKLRNYIAHCKWTKGNRENSIRPFILDIRSGKIVTKGINPEDEDFTLDDLIKAHDNLAGSCKRLRKFITDYGYEAIIAENMEEARPDNET